MEIRNSILVPIIAVTFLQDKAIPLNNQGILDVVGSYSRNPQSYLARILETIRGIPQAIPGIPGAMSRILEAIPGITKAIRFQFGFATNFFIDFKAITSPFLKLFKLDSGFKNY